MVLAMTRAGHGGTVCLLADGQGRQASRRPDRTTRSLGERTSTSAAERALVSFTLACPRASCGNRRSQARK